MEKTSEVPTVSSRSSADRYVVCTREEMKPGEMRAYTAGRRRLAIARLEDGSYRAVADTCPHEGARLSAGKVEKMWVSDEVGRYACAERHVIICPWHNFEFDTDTGRAYTPHRLRVKTYRIELEGEDVVVYV